MSDYGYLTPTQMMAVTGGDMGSPTNELPTPAVEIHDTDYGNSYRPFLQRGDHNPDEPPPLIIYAEVYQYDGKWYSFVESDGGGVGSSSYDTRQEAVEDIHKRIESYRRFWEGKLHDLRSGTSPKKIIAGGHWYTIGEEPAPNAHRNCLGYGGRKFVFRMLDSGKEVVSHNVWFGGRIPREYLSYFPDNAEILEG